MEEIELNVRLNADIPKQLKTRLKLYCVNENVYMNEIVAMALENFLDEMEGIKC
ncbi:hypothetical protein [Heyndrickxia acidicola]|uniref:CopG family transcriptional regulator n=1 Tax=Heyndrickxia acidicola TaxID=209389 RepID=A0ABU6MLN5_9BACI|nr:hypothetical protein [Heyndrickxia acidicola]MED1205591.1 hypothetical protein [Heyndrickxia acidicola]